MYLDTYVRTHVRTYADLKPFFFSEVYDLLQFWCVLLSFCFFYLFCSWGNLPLHSYWSLSCDRGLHCSHDVNNVKKTTHTARELSSRQSEPPKPCDITESTSPCSVYELFSKSVRTCSGTFGCRISMHMGESSDNKSLHAGPTDRKKKVIPPCLYLRCDFEVVQFFDFATSQFCDFTKKKSKNVSCEYGRWVVETQLCKLRDT